MNKYTIKNGNQLCDMYLVKYHNKMAAITDNLNIQSEQDIENVIDVLTKIHRDFYKKFNLLSNRSELLIDLWRSKLLKLEKTINEIIGLERRLSDYIASTDKPTDYTKLMLKVQDNVIKELKCI